MHKYVIYILYIIHTEHTHTHFFCFAAPLRLSDDRPSSQSSDFSPHSSSKKKEEEGCVCVCVTDFFFFFFIQGGKEHTQKPKRQNTVSIVYTQYV